MLAPRIASRSRVLYACLFVCVCVCSVNIQVQSVPRRRRRRWRWRHCHLSSSSAAAAAAAGEVIALQWWCRYCCIWPSWHLPPTLSVCEIIWCSRQVYANWQTVTNVAVSNKQMAFDGIIPDHIRLRNLKNSTQWDKNTLTSPTVPQSHSFFISFLPPKQRM